MRRWSLCLALPALLSAASQEREMVLKTPDGYTLKGTLVIPEGKGRKPVVILAHEFMQTRKGWGPLVAELHARGLATLALDLRGHGASTDKAGAQVKAEGKFMEDAKKVGFDQIPADLALAAAWVRKQPGIQGRLLGFAGSSVGAMSVLLAAPKVRPVAVLSLSPAGTSAFGEEGRVKLVEATKRGGAAVFVISSQDDTDAAQNLRALQGLGGVYAQLLPGKDHGFDYLEARKDTMAVFFKEYLHRHAPVAKEKAVQ